MTQPISQTDLPGLTLLKRGKVRDMYDLGEHFLMVATDRISAFDVIMDDPIPDKGVILTQISLFWFDVMRPIVANHVVSSRVEEFPAVCRPYADQLLTAVLPAGEILGTDTFDWELVSIAPATQPAATVFSLIPRSNRRWSRYSVTVASATGGPAPASAVTATSPPRRRPARA